MQFRPAKNPTTPNRILLLLLGLAGFAIVFLLLVVAYLYSSRPGQTASAEIPPTSITDTPTSLPSATSEPTIAVTETSVPTPMHPTVVPPASAGGLATVLTTDYLHVRSGPSLLYPVYGLLPPQTQAEVVGVSPDHQWWAVKVPTSLTADGIGWVSGQYVSVSSTQSIPVLTPPPVPEQVPVPPPQSTGPFITTVEPVNVRSGPGTDYPSYGVAPLGTTGEVIGVNADRSWWEVRLPTNLAPDGTGWISAAYVTAQNVDNVPVVAPPPLPSNLEILPPEDSEARLMTVQPVDVRSGPGIGYASYGEMPAGRRGKILGVSSDGTWYEIALPNGIAPDGTGWVDAGYVIVFNTQGVEVVEP